MGGTLASSLSEVAPAADSGGVHRPALLTQPVPLCGQGRARVRGDTWQEDTGEEEIC